MSRKFQVIKWSIEQAASEFGINPRTLTARIKQQGIEADKRRHYTTRQICDAVFGDISGEKLRKLTADRELAELRLARERGELIRRDDAAQIWDDHILACRQEIKASGLSEMEKRVLLGKLQSLPKERYGAVMAEQEKGPTEQEDNA